MHFDFSFGDIYSHMLTVLWNYPMRKKIRFSLWTLLLRFTPIFKCFLFSIYANYSGNTCLCLATLRQLFAIHNISVESTALVTCYAKLRATRPACPPATHVPADRCPPALLENTLCGNAQRGMHFNCVQIYHLTGRGFGLQVVGHPGRAGLIFARRYFFTCSACRKTQP